MKDLISKATFGFLMAQLFPGAVAVFAIAFTYFAFEDGKHESVLATASAVLHSWNNASLSQQLFLAGLCVGFGMFIHGLHWAVLGHLEHRHGGSVYNSRFHHAAIWIQVVGGPLRAALEMLWFFTAAKDVRQTSMEENVTSIHHDFMPQFEFLEDFYLYAAQFFVHTAYALLVVFAAVGGFTTMYGFTLRRVILLALAYAAAGVFFVLGRVHFRSLFEAEHELARMSAWRSVLAPLEPGSGS